MSRRRRNALGAAAVAFVLVVAVLTDRWFVHPRVDDPGTADAVFVLGGGGQRIQKAYELASRGVADVVVISSELDPATGEWSAIPCNGFRPFDVPATVAFECVQPDPATTRGEARMLRDLADTRGWRRVAVIATTDQVTRARTLIGRCWDGEVRMVAVPHDQWLLRRVVYEWGAAVKATVLRSC